MREAVTSRGLLMEMDSMEPLVKTKHKEKSADKKGGRTRRARESRKTHCRGGTHHETEKKIMLRKRQKKDTSQNFRSPQDQETSRRHEKPCDIVSSSVHHSSEGCSNLMLADEHKESIAKNWNHKGIWVNNTSP